MTEFEQEVAAKFGFAAAYRGKVPRNEPLGLAEMSTDNYLVRLPSLLIAAADSSVNSRLTQQAVSSLLIPPHQSPLGASEFVARMRRLSPAQRAVVSRFLRSHALAWAEAGLGDWLYEAMADSLARFWEDPTDERLRALLPTQGRREIAERMDMVFPVEDPPRQEFAPKCPLFADEPALCKALFGRRWPDLVDGWWDVQEGSAIAQLAPLLPRFDWFMLRYYLPAFMVAALDARAEAGPAGELLGHVMDRLADPPPDFPRLYNYDQRRAVREFALHALEEFGEPGGCYTRVELLEAVELYWPHADPPAPTRPPKAEGKYSYEPSRSL